MIFPTVTNGILNIKGLRNAASMTIYDLHGKCLVSMEVTPKENVVDLRDYNIVNGIYMVSIFSDLMLNVLNTKVVVSQ
jgi:myo-inositol-hexaphosphate 3-phosphohydrolase